MTTFIPRDSYSQSELNTLYPRDLALTQVQVLLRHGERSPVNARFKNAGLPAYWPYCNAAQQLRSVIQSASDSWDELAYRRKLETFGKDDSATFAIGAGGAKEGICLPGELTDEGRETTRALGQRLRRLYVDQLNFIPANLSSTEPFYLRATPIPRALESVQQVFYGLYPPTTRSPTLPPPQIVTRSPNDETLYPNEGACRRFAQLSHAFAQRTADRWNESDEMAYLNNLISKWMPEDSPKVKVDSHPRLSGIMDTVNSTLAHGPLTRLPKEFYDDKGREIIDKIGVEEWYSGYGESREYRMLGIGGLLGDVVGRMVDHVRLQNGIKPVPGTEDVQFALSGCHDTTLASVLASLGAFDGEKWPPYTSHIAIELFKRQIPSAFAAGAVEPATTGSSSWWSKIFGSPAESIKGPTSSRTPLTQMSASEKGGLDGYFVRLRYNDRVMTVPACRPEGKHYEGDESICTLETFKGVVDKFTPANWKRACNSNIGESAFPESPEPAGA